MIDGLCSFGLQQVIQSEQERLELTSYLQKYGKVKMDRAVQEQNQSSSWFTAEADCLASDPFHLPFSTVDGSLVKASNGLEELSSRRLGLATNSRYFEHSLQDNMRNDGRLIIKGADQQTLLPGTELSQAIVQLFMSWITSKKAAKIDVELESVHAFGTTFVRDLMSNGYTKSLERHTRDVNIFQKTLLLFPIQADSEQWSLFAVVNPGRIQKTKFGNNPKDEVCCMIRLDPMGFMSSSDDANVANQVRTLLNREWSRLRNNGLDVNQIPFNKRSMPTLSPSTGKCCHH